MVSVLAAVCAARAELIPSARLVDWTPGVAVGVPGGIDSFLAGGAKERKTIVDVTKAPYSADNSGSTNAGPAIQNAVNDALPGTVLYLPAGTYRFDSGLRVNQQKSNITIRGAGESTVVMLYGTCGFGSFGVGSDWSYPNSGNVVRNGLTKGSTQLTLDDTSGFIVGNNIRLGIANDPSLPVVSVQGYDLITTGEPMRRQITRVVAKTANTLTIYPALYGDYSSTKAVVHGAQMQLNFFGLEDLRIDATNTTELITINFEQCYGSWIKNVHILNSQRYHINLEQCLNCEIRECYLDHLNHSGPNGAALLVNTVAASLFENNVIVDAQPLLEVNHGSCGNVFAFNFCDIGAVPLDTNHGPHNAFNLYEGNIAPGIMADGFFGSVSDDTFYRNWLTGVNGGVGTYTVALKRFTRNYSFVGNILGTSGISSGGYDFGKPNIGNGSSSGTAQLSKGIDWADRTRTGIVSSRASDISAAISLTAGTNGMNVGQWPITARWGTSGRGWLTALSMTASTVVLGDGPTNVSNGTAMPSQGSTMQLWVGSSGFQELDLDVEATTLRRANYMASASGGGAIPSTEALGSDTLPGSLFRTAKPSWWGSRTWPAFDPTKPVQTYDAIPAGARYTAATGLTASSGATSGESGGSSGTSTGSTTTGTGSGTGTSTTSTGSGTGTTTANQVPLNVRVSHPNH